MLMPNISLKETSRTKSLDDEVRLTSWNVNSMGDRIKTRNIFNKLNKERSNIFCLVDTRTSKETKHIFDNKSVTQCSPHSRSNMQTNNVHQLKYSTNAHAKYLVERNFPYKIS